MKQLLLVCFCCAFQQHVLSQSNLVRSTTGASGSSEEIMHGGDTYIIQQSIGQSSVIGTTDNGTYIFRQGFIQPDVLSKIIDKNVPLNLQITIYPNPFQERISLVFNENVTDDIHVTVFNILGALVFSKSYQPNQQIDLGLNWLSSGEYIIKTIANKKQFISKILKK
ncbi:T9SS type A sorting domain-containing protein [Confluentibacter sediminis]|uniref:T9SS type A sorting domain-containing protein n=1 Tax=Confluentibacter sediminis TaxID=2219045 RepID=UPI000DABCFDA|nr:T9SS type A sorting domain-containing protein [Confluentibacter sediminis]